VSDGVTGDDNTPWAVGNLAGERLLLLEERVAYTVRGGCGPALGARARAAVITRWRVDFGAVTAEGVAVTWVPAVVIALPITVVWCLWELGASEGWFRGC